jgi:hypothetical protein
VSEWKTRFLSFGGRLVVLKSVLTFLSVYVISFFNSPSCIISSIESFLTFLEGSEDFRKTSLINWKIICLQNEYG